MQDVGSWKLDVIFPSIIKHPASNQKIKIMGLLTILYLIGSITFILGLKMLSNPATARKGNLLAAAGMVVAILGTIFLYQDEEGQN